VAACCDAGSMPDADHRCGKSRPGQSNANSSRPCGRGPGRLTAAGPPNSSAALRRRSWPPCSRWASARPRSASAQRPVSSDLKRDDWYGRALSVRTGLGSGTVLQALYRLENWGWLESRWEDRDKGQLRFAPGEGG
jgi:hypothetical protein